MNKVCELCKETLIEYIRYSKVYENDIHLNIKYFCNNSCLYKWLEKEN